MLSAAFCNCTEIAEILIKNRRNIEERNHDGETPLIIASRMEGEETAELLISHGANTNAVDNNEKNVA